MDLDKGYNIYYCSVNENQFISNLITNFSHINKKTWILKSRSHLLNNAIFIFRIELKVKKLLTNIPDL